MNAHGASRLWEGGWIQVKVPLPFSLKWVNSYLIPGDDGLTLIDPGLHTPEGTGVWNEIMELHSIRPKDIVRIVLTHQHPDHYGLAGWFQERSGAPVFMSKPSHDYAVRLWGSGRRFADDLISMYAAHGMPGDILEQIGPHLESFVQKVSPQPAVRYLELDGSFAFGGMEWETIHTPGHARGHLCFYHEASGRMICGDQVLPDITPNISVVPGPGEDADPLRTFLDSLDKLSRYNVDMAFPGHRDPFSGFAARIGELKRHHERRLRRMEERLSLPFTAFEICEWLFGERIGGNIHNLRFAMSETLAHLHYLVRLERVRECCGDDGIVRFLK